MLIRKLATALLFVPLCALAQKGKQQKNAYPQDYFRNPLDIPIFLAGNFGECRPGHFHSGVDIKTKGEENQIVHAAADGYISRIKMEKGGFGHGIYITHPSGYTTLYAHLNDFAPAIQQYVREKQYEAKRWDVDLQLTPSQFPVKKGQQIAWSGNTGASTAPHLHFEIRSTKTEHPLNPELFGLPVVDKKAPVIPELVLYSGSVYEEGDQCIRTAQLKKTAGLYVPANGTGDLVNSGSLCGVGLVMDDYMDGSDNTLAIYTAKLYMDDSLQSSIVLDDIGYDVTRYINAYADYKTHAQHGKWVQCLFKLPGNHLNSIYPYLNATDGRLDLSDNKLHRIYIVVADDKGNESKVKFNLQGQPAIDTLVPAGSIPFLANKVNKFNDPNVSFSLDENELYDDISFMFSKKEGDHIFSDKYIIHYAYIPLHHYFELKVKPNKPVPFDLRSKMVLMYNDGKDDDGRAAIAAEEGWYRASVRNFGTYWLDVDTTAPAIRSLQKDGAVLTAAKQITFEAKDAMTSVKTFAGYLDGKWICFEQHGNSFFYKFDEHCSKGKHELIFKAADENGNERQAQLTFTR